MAASIRRREFLKTTLLAGVVPFVGIELLAGTDHIEFTRHDVGLQGSFGETIVLAQLSDLHLQSIVLSKGLAHKVNAENPDVILLSGDTFDLQSDLVLLSEYGIFLMSELLSDETMVLCSVAVLA